MWPIIIHLNSSICQDGNQVSVSLLNTEMETVTASKENEEIKEPCTPETVDIYRSASNCSNIENSLEI